MAENGTAEGAELMAGAARAAGIAPPAIVQPTDHEVRLGGLRFHYVDWGNAHLPHVVLLHGGSLTAHTWDMTALLLRDRYHLVALDQRGHGDSDWTPHVEDDTGALMIEDTRAFIEHLGYEHLTLVGMSMGGINAFHHAARHPEGLDALVIVDVGPELMRRRPHGDGAVRAGDGDAGGLRGLPGAGDRVQPRSRARAPALQPDARAQADSRGLDVEERPPRAAEAGRGGAEALPGGAHGGAVGGGACDRDADAADARRGEQGAVGGARGRRWSRRWRTPSSSRSRARGTPCRATTPPTSPARWTPSCSARCRPEGSPRGLPGRVLRDG